MRKTLLFLTVFTAITAFSQEDQQVIVIRQSDLSKPVKARKPKVERNVENYNAFKFDPFRMFIGEINFAWEHRIHEKTTFEIEFGPTISNLSYTKNNNHYGNIYGGELYNDEQAAMGVLVSAAVRYYPLEDYHAMNKLYISPRVKYRRYNEIYSLEGTSLEDREGYSNEVIFSFNIGFQDWLSNNFAFDYYVGMGIGSYVARSSYSSVEYNPETGMNDKYVWVDQKDRLARVVGVIGMKVTIGN